jgi:hypothetical protein
MAMELAQTKDESPPRLDFKAHHAFLVYRDHSKIRGPPELA